jgi:hypothetical protein
VGRDLKSAELPTLLDVDLDGDGRDEQLVHGADRLCALQPDLTERWSWPSGQPIRKILPVAAGRPAMVVLGNSVCLDGATGSPRWSIGPSHLILNADDGKSPPRALFGPEGTTVCREALPVTPNGMHTPAQGSAARPAVFGDDPRWRRPLPWAVPIEPYLHPVILLAMCATLVNICIPGAILWLATRRRFWSTRLLLALPVVVAILLTGNSAMSALILDSPQTAAPLWWGVLVAIVLVPMAGIPIVAYATAFVLSLVRVRWLKWALALPVVAGILVAGCSALVFLIPEPRQRSSSWWSIPLDIAVLSITGLPIVVYAAALGSALAHRAGRKTARLLARTLVAAILIGVLAFLLDRLAKPSIEHYDWSGWHQAGYLGAYAVGVVVLLARPARAAGRFVLRLVRRRRVVI